jgi:hypothetical protein
MAGALPQPSLLPPKLPLPRARQNVGALLHEAFGGSKANAAVATRDQWNFSAQLSPLSLTFFRRLFRCAVYSMLEWRIETNRPDR